MSTYDAYTRISNVQVLNASNPSRVAQGLYLATDRIKIVDNITTRVQGRDIGPGAPIVIRLRIDQTFAGVTAGGGGGVSVSLAYMTADTGISGVFQPALDIADVELIAGREYDILVAPLPASFFSLVGGNGSAYITLLFTCKTVSGTTVSPVDPTAGAVSAWVPLGHDAGLPKRYLGNYTGP